MVRKSVLATLAVIAIVLGGVVVSTPAGAVVDSAVVVPSPNPSTSYNRLSSVSCVSVSFCVATGYQNSGSLDLTLVEHWDGASWSTVTSPSPGTNSNVLSSVSCVSVSFCVATGNQYSGSANLTLVEQWDGTSWSTVTSPNPGTTANSLGSVSCVSVSFCVATGFQDSGSTNQPLFKTLVVSLTGPVPPTTTTTTVAPEPVIPAFTG